MSKIPDPTSAATIRLPASYWTKLRELMQAYGRKWLEKAIEREYKHMERPTARADKDAHPKRKVRSK